MNTLEPARFVKIGRSWLEKSVKPKVSLPLETAEKLELST